MHEGNQEPERPGGVARDPAPVAPPSPEAPASDTPGLDPPAAEPVLAGTAVEAAAAAPSVERAGLSAWLGILLASGLASIAFRLPELGMLAMIAGMFVVAQAADADPRHRHLLALVAWTVPVGGAILFGSLTAALVVAPLEFPWRPLAVGIAAGAVPLSLLPLIPPISIALAAGTTGRA
jgi:hypothetical protein